MHLATTIPSRPGDLRQLRLKVDLASTHQYGHWNVVKHLGEAPMRMSSRMVVAVGSLSSSEAATEAAAPTDTSSTAESCSTLPPQIQCRLKDLRQRLGGVKEVTPNKSWGF